MVPTRRRRRSAPQDPAAPDETKGKINDWAGPELLKAGSTMRRWLWLGTWMRSRKVDASGGTVTINGETLTAEQA